jgi:hypothetical protein
MRHPIGKGSLSPARLLHQEPPQLILARVQLFLAQVGEAQLVFHVLARLVQFRLRDRARRASPAVAVFGMPFGFEIHALGMPHAYALHSAPGALI